VSDVTEGLVRAGFVDGLGGQEVDLGTGILTSLHDVIEQVAELIGAPVAPRFGARPERPMERPRRANVAESERQLLGWKSEISLAEGLRRTVDALKDGYEESSR
jgi:nucleoside-diphosphate-sugar epimerase